MELILFLGLVGIGLLGFILWYCIKIFDELQYTRNLILKTMGSTQSNIKTQKRSDPNPRVHKPKAEQHYEGQGTPRQKPGAEPRAITASGTPVRIGKVAQRRVGGTPRNPESP